MSAIARAARVAESILAAVLVVIALPFIALTAALSFAQYRAWPFFVHSRVGLDGTTFRLIKVRTLPPDTARYVDKYSLGFTRVPTTMAWVRRLHFDELPQLLHVASGRMAFVGPRPEMASLHDQLPPAFAAERTSVRPGLTCLWQISRHNTGLIGERPEFDMLYVRYGTPRLDLWIICRTALKMLTGRTVHLHEVPAWTMRGSSLKPARVPVAEHPLGVVD